VDYGEIALSLPLLNKINIISMRTLPLKYQIILAPMVLIIPILFVILLTLSYLNSMGQQNDTVRDWVRATDQLQIGISSIHSLQDTSELLRGNTGQEAEELAFDYLEKSRLLNESLKHPSLLDKADKETLHELQTLAKKVHYKDNLDVTTITPVLATLLPRMDYLYRSLQAQKRSIYIDSNEDISRITSQLATISISVLGVCVLLGIILSLWINKSTGRRLRTLTASASTLCNRPASISTVKKPRDELDELASCLSLISQRQLNLLATEKLLEGAEEERRRIAMDIHDQFLSDVANITRSLDEIEQSPEMTQTNRQELQRIQDNLRDLTSNLRAIIDDLHPSSLNMLGLEAAIRSFLERKLSTNPSVDYFLSIDKMVDEYLDERQCLNLYRIIQELVTNILRHAHCTRFEINLQPVDETLILSVEDNGIGFDLQQALKKSGHGLININQRALAIQAEYQWLASRFSSGSCFKLSIPVKQSIANINTITDNKAIAHGG